MNVTSLKGKTALVTGGASGIGRATALALAQRGADLVICDIDEAGLASTAEEIRTLGREAFTQRVDVASAEQMEAFADAVHGRLESVDILMNNAGVAIAGAFLDTSLPDWEWIVGINLRGVVHGCHFFVPNMVRRARGGHVINVSSAAGYSTSSNLAAYNATKYGVLGLSEALWDELRPHGIGVTAACPGVIDTPITRNARLVGKLDQAKMREDIVRTYQRRRYTPERVAQKILEAVQKNRVVAPISPESWVLYYLKRLAPGTLRWVMHELGQRATRRAPAD
ncbi:MAG: SDR family NAD(P)-dependent oxidoreductase [Deltaproteobacteria bacterium]|nr:SDR family NAD(P)-dependent oxidoreductase [Deltaproteobacteria bacterium]MBW2419846.1 SDR family NAD(P)-dependent oxidoreductase [Deltaproteobacteria bacterium]